MERTTDQEKKILEQLKKLYPRLNEQELSEAREVLERYVNLAWKIAERIVDEKSSSPVRSVPDKDHVL